MTWSAFGEKMSSTQPPASTRLEIAGQSFDVDQAQLARFEHERPRLEQELTELQALGVRVTHVVLPEDGGPPRYSLVFPDGELQYRTRLKAEKAGFDVGQHLGDRRLAFYLSRRSHKSEGWDV
jgi:hypothetical protein